MAVKITTECISCDACATECPVAAILDDSNEKNPFNSEIYYVKPESCVECVGHADEPRCVEACPTEARTFGDLDNPTSNVSRLLGTRGSFVLREEMGTHPKVQYLSK